MKIDKISFTLSVGLLGLFLIFTASQNSVLADNNTQKNFQQLSKEELQKIEDQKIQFLLEKVEKSDAIFIRNGDEHPAKKARSHLEQKMNMGLKMFWFFGPKKTITAQEFIDKVASGSSTSGKPYHIRTKDGKTFTTKEWLEERLKEYPKSSQSP